MQVKSVIIYILVGITIKFLIAQFPLFACLQVKGFTGFRNGKNVPCAKWAWGMELARPTLYLFITTAYLTMFTVLDGQCSCPNTTMPDITGYM